MAMSLDTIANKLEGVLKLYYSVDSRLTDLDRSYNRLAQEFSQLRIDHVRLEGRLATLEGLRESMRKDVEIEIRDAISQLKIDWLTKQLEAATVQTKQQLTTSNPVVDDSNQSP